MTDMEKIKQLWSDPGSLASTLLLSFWDMYGPEATQWDPQTIWSELSDDLKVVVPTVNFDKLMASILVATTDRFFRSLPDFITVCNVFSGSSFDPTVFDPADAAECAWGITEAILIEPPDKDNEEPFSKEICAYIGKAIEDEGMINPPDILKIGTRSPGHRDPGTDYQDDPEMYHMIRATEQSKTDDLRRLIRDRLSLLVGQLRNLPVKNGSTEDVIGKMLQHIPRSQ